MLCEQKDVVVKGVSNYHSNFIKKTCLVGINEESKWFVRKFHTLPKYLKEGSKIFYIENNKIIGYGIAKKIVKNPKQKFGHISLNGGFSVYMLTKEWKWIEPLSSDFSQTSGWRYFNSNNINVIGRWCDTKFDSSQPIDGVGLSDLIEIGRKKGFFQ